LQQFELHQHALKTRFGTFVNANSKEVRMEIATREVAAVEQTTKDATANQASLLAELELVVMGGGFGEVSAY
jgi:hypothetical protein